MALAGFCSGSALAQTRIATVDLKILFEKYWKTKQADAALKDRATDLDKEYKGLRDDLKKANEEYQKLLADANDQAVSAEERDKRKKAAETKLKSIKETEDTVVQFERQARTSLDEQRTRMREKILEEIRATLNVRAKTSGIGLVVDTAATTVNNTPFVLYNTGDSDLTQVVLDQLNASAPVETSKPAEKKVEKKDEKKDDKK